MPRDFCDLTEDCQACCASALDTSSAGCFGQVSKACNGLVAGRLVEEKAERDRAVLEKVSSHWGKTLSAMCCVANGPNLITFSDGGQKLFKCVCSPDKELCVGRGFSNVARHLGTRQHWKHWRLVAFGEAQPSDAAWHAFAASARLERRHV